MIKALEDFSLFARRWWPVGLWMAVIGLGSLDWASGGHTFPVIKAIGLWFNPKLSYAQLYDLNLLFRKACHFLQFLVLALLVWRTRGSWRFVSPRADFRFSLFVLIVSVVPAVASEVVQRLVSSRTASFQDVLINMSGAVAGVLIALVIEAFTGRKEPAKPRVLLTADLHLDAPESGAAALAKIREAVEAEKPDILVIAGNIGSPLQAVANLRRLKECTNGTRLAFCLGNQDHWLPLEHWTECRSPADVREKYWRPAANQVGIPCLDFGNVEIGGLVICGGYGHFDLEFRDQTLSLDGRTVEIEDYRNGSLAGLECKDMSRIPNVAKTLEAEAIAQAGELGARLAAAGERPVLLVTGMAPFLEWSGHAGTPGSILNFFQAFAGNSQLQPVLARAQNIQLAVCGRTHAPTGIMTVRGIRGLNVGNTDGALRFAVWEGDTAQVRLL